MPQRENTIDTVDLFLRLLASDRSDAALTLMAESGEEPWFEDPLWAEGLAGLCHYLGGDFVAIDSSAERLRSLIEVASDAASPERQLACAITGLAAAVGSTGARLRAAAPVGITLRDRVALFAAVEEELSLARLVAADALMRSFDRQTAAGGVIPPGVGEDVHPFEAFMELTMVRVIAFQGRIDEAVERGEALVATMPATGRLALYAEAVLCLIGGNAGHGARVRAIAERIAHELSAPHTRLASGCHLLVAYGLVAVGETAWSARAVLHGRGIDAVISYPVIDRGLALELLVAAAVGDGELASAESWQQLAEPLRDNPIARPAVLRIESRIALLAGQTERAIASAQEAIELATANGRALEASEGGIVLGRAQIAHAEPGEAASMLARMVDGTDALGHTAARRAAARELRAIGRRLRPSSLSGWRGLSEREREVALLVAEGLSNEQVAHELHLSRHTVRAHLSRTLAALGVASRVQLAVALARMHPRTPEAGDAALPTLTPRQGDVAAALVRGQSNESIAEELGISVKTVEKHIADIQNSWQLSSRLAIAVHALTELDERTTTAPPLPRE